MHPVPVLGHFHTGVQILAGDGSDIPVRVQIDKPVDVVALLLQLFAPQLRQPLDLIQIVEAVPVGGKAVLPGEQPFDFLHGRPIQAVQTHGDPPLARVGLQGLDDGFAAAAAGIDVHAASVPMGEQHQLSLHQRELLMAPDIDIDKGILTAAVRAGEEEIAQRLSIAQLRSAKGDHKIPSFGFLFIISSVFPGNKRIHCFLRRKTLQ